MDVYPQFAGRKSKYKGLTASQQKKNENHTPLVCPFTLLFDLLVDEQLAQISLSPMRAKAPLSCDDVKHDHYAAINDSALTNVAPLSIVMQSSSPVAVRALVYANKWSNYVAMSTY